MRGEEEEEEGEEGEEGAVVESWEWTPYSV